MPYQPLTQEQYSSLRTKYSPEKIVEFERQRKSEISAIELEVRPPERGFEEFGKGVVRGVTSLVPSSQVTSLAARVMPRLTGTSIIRPPVPSTETIKRGYGAIAEKAR